jgi:hypothetical protein
VVYLPPALDRGSRVRETQPLLLVKKRVVRAVSVRVAKLGTEVLHAG